MRLPSIFWLRLSFQRPWHRRGRRDSHFLTILIPGARSIVAVAAVGRTAVSAPGSNAWQPSAASADFANVTNSTIRAADPTGPASNNRASLH